MEELTRRLLGYVNFKMEKGDFERFLTLCAKNEVRVWNIRRKGEAMLGSTTLSGYKSFAVFRRKTKSKINITGKKGLPFTVRPLLKRKGLIFGILAFIAIYAFLSSHIWSVSVEGNETISQKEVLSAAESLGLYAGALKKSVDPAMIKENLMYTLPDTSWVSVNTLGCTATVCIKEKIKAPQIEDKSYPSNVYALFSGRITQIEVFAGEAVVKEGDAVNEGEMLISGVMKTKNGETYLTHAYGNVTAKTRRVLTIEIPKEETVLEETGECVFRCSANILGVDIPLTLCESPKGCYKKESKRFPFRIGQIELPVMIFKEKWTKMEEKTVINGKLQAEKRAKDEAVKLFSEKHPNAQIERTSFELREEKNRYVMSAAFICSENIAQVTDIIDK